MSEKRKLLAGRSLSRNISIKTQWKVRDSSPCTRLPSTKKPGVLLPGFPAENIQAYEIYNSKAQISARTHPALINTQRFLLSLWHDSSSTQGANLDIPISYFDRLRIRTPGDRSFTLGPHIDGGSIERWEDPEFRKVWGSILGGGSQWREHDSFDISPRINAKQDLYDTPYVSTFFWGIHIKSFLIRFLLEINAPFFAVGRAGPHSLLQAPGKVPCAFFLCFPWRRLTYYSVLSSVPKIREARVSLSKTGSLTWIVLPFQGVYLWKLRS